MSPHRPGHSKYLRGGYLAPSEHVLYETHPSRWFYFFYPTLGLGLVLFAAYAAAAGIWTRLPSVPWLTRDIGRLPDLPWGIDGFHLVLYGAGVLVAVALLWIGAVRLFVWPTWTYVVTDDRIIQQYGLVRHDFQEIPLRQIRDIQIRQDSIWDRWRGFGTLHFHSLSSPDMSMEGPVSYDLIRDPRCYPSPRGNESEASEKWRIQWIRERHPRMTESAAEELSKALAGAEWWGGVPKPLRIQREVEQALRRGYGSDPVRDPGTKS